MAGLRLRADVCLQFRCRRLNALRARIRALWAGNKCGRYVGRMVLIQDGCIVVSIEGAKGGFQSFECEVREGTAESTA